MQFLKPLIVLAAVMVCYVHATILDAEKVLLEAHTSGASELKELKAAFVRSVDRMYRPNAKAFWENHAVPRAAAGLDVKGKHWNEYFSQPRF